MLYIVAASTSIAVAEYAFPPEKAPQLGRELPRKWYHSFPSLAFNPAGIGTESALSRLILEWTGEGRREERTILAAILPDRRLDVAASQRVRRFVGGSHLVPPWLK